MKKKFVGLFLGLATAFIGFNSVEAAKISVIGSDSATVGETLTLNVKISELNGEQVIGIGGQISYDKEYLELVSMEGIKAPYSVDYNLKNAKFAGVSFTGKSISEDKNILKVTFKVKKDGSTVVGFSDYELTNFKTDVIKDTTPVSKSIVINEKQEEVVPVVEKEEVKKEEKAVVKTSNKSKSEVVVKEENVVVEVPVEENVVEVKEVKQEVAVETVEDAKTSSMPSKALANEKNNKEEVKNTKDNIVMVSFTSFFDNFKALFTNDSIVNNSVKSTSFLDFLGERLMEILKRA